MDGEIADTLEGLGIGDVSPDELKERAAALREEEKEGLRELQRINLSIGLPGGVVLFESIIKNCPGLSPKDRKRFLKQIISPPNLKKDLVGTLEVKYYDKEAKKWGKALLRSGECAPDRDVAKECARLFAHTTDKETEEVNKNLSVILKFIQMAYAAMLTANVGLLRDLGDRLNGFNPQKLCYDPASATFYLGIEDAERNFTAWEPRAGCMVVYRDE